MDIYSLPPPRCKVCGAEYCYEPAFIDIDPAMWTPTCNCTPYGRIGAEDYLVSLALSLQAKVVVLSAQVDTLTAKAATLEYELEFARLLEEEHGLQ